VATVVGKAIWWYWDGITSFGEKAYKLKRVEGKKARCWDKCTEVGFIVHWLILIALWIYVLNKELPNIDTVFSQSTSMTPIDTLDLLYDERMPFMGVT